MNLKTRLLTGLILLALLSSCGGQVSQTQPTPVGQTQPTKTCSDLRQVVEAFYADNDASQFAKSVQYLTDDVVLIGWAEGVNGHHMSIFSAVGKDQVQELLGQPGLKRSASQPDLPNYTMQEVQLSQGKMAFKLIPDRPHPDNRPYNPFAVEAFFSGCQIEILKVVERVTWL